MLCVEQLCLRVVSELDQLEGEVEWLVGSGDPEAWALLLSMTGRHLEMTMRHVAVAMAISDAETPPVSTLPNPADHSALGSGHACPLLTKTVPTPAGSVDKD